MRKSGGLTPGCPQQELFFSLLAGVEGKIVAIYQKVEVKGRAQDGLAVVTKAMRPKGEKR